ncbi:hypothetical protein EAF04_006945 [Stromatinia cepivora]|nr:hypothetical protein EAF04_006945 [Stromatinia cepivora]
MPTGNTPPVSLRTLPKAPWVQQPRRSDTPTSVYSNTHSPMTEAPNSPTTTTSSSPRVGVPSRSSSPTISPISLNNSSHTEFRSSRYQITPPQSPGSSAHSRPPRSRNQTSQCKSTNFLISKWGIGWKTPTIMISCYLLALATALLHLFLFIYISGKAAEGKDRVAPQTYIFTASNILANVFSFFLKTALGTSFVQYLWRLLRVQTMKVSTIDSLFGLRSNIFHMFTGAAIRASPVLCVLSIIMASMTITVSFPPGAINIVSVQRTSYNSVVVPTFNASFMGNGSGVAANQYSLATLLPIFESANGSVSGFRSSGSLSGKYSNLLPRLAFQTMITGQAFEQPSPCGENCSFVLEFEGPTLECNSSSKNITTSQIGNAATDFPFFTIYSGNWTSDFSPATSAPPNVLSNGTYTNAYWQSSTLTLLDAEITVINSTLHNTTTTTTTTLNTSTTQNNLYCIPGRALYTINNTYISNMLTRNISSTFISPLSNLQLSTPNNSIAVPGFANISGMATDHGFGNVPANWSVEARAYYRDLNMMMIVNTMFYYLAGGYTAMPAIWLETDEERVQDIITNKGWGESPPIFGNADAGTSGAQNNTIIFHTPLNSAFTHYSNPSPNPSFHLTQSTLNALLQNITLSSIPLLTHPTTTIHPTAHHRQLIYTFSPLHLLLPYILSLLLTLPLLLLGLWALLQNGVAANDCTFTMGLCTTSFSSSPFPSFSSPPSHTMSTPTQLLTLSRAACLGNPQSLSKPLRDLRIRYGELRSSLGGNDHNNNNDNGTHIRRAGFGLESEVVPLVKGEKYGVIL